MSFEVTDAEFDRIADLIGSDESPVGIDAKKTHVLIMRKLLDLEDRLRRIEERLAKLPDS